MASSTNIIGGFIPESFDISSTLTSRFDYHDGVGETTSVYYMGYAPAGALTSAAVWRVSKVTYNASMLATGVTFADGNANFDNIWANRASLSYS